MVEKKKVKYKGNKKNSPAKTSKSKKFSSEDKKKIAGTVAAGVGAGIGAAIWYFVKKVLAGLAAFFVLIVIAKLLWCWATGNPYPWGFGG